jgi:uncharacterized protein YndB with AHSA1/START domain
MKWLLVGLLVIAALAAIVVAAGAMLPVEHAASREGVFPAAPEAIWRLITDVDGFPTWRPDVKRVTRLPEREGKAHWTEETTSGRITFAVERMESPRLLVVRIADPDLPFGGTWTYELTPAAGGTTLTLTEHGEIYNPLFRFMARFVFGYEATMASYVEALRKRTSSAEANHGI